MDRGTFLARVRERLASGVDAYGGAHPLASTDAGAVPAARWPDDPRPLSELFADRAEAHGGRVRTLTSYEELRDLVTEIVDTHGIRTAVVTDEPATGPARTALEELGVELRAFDSWTAADADLGVTGGIAAIARTGTVVVDTAAAGGRSASLLPDVHLALLPLATLIAEPAEFWRGIPTRYPDGMPSQIVLITGPSKSADIEGALTVGVHGPRAVWVGLSSGHR